MRVIAKRTLREFWRRHPDAERPLLSWHREMEDEDWDAPTGVKGRYPHASILRNNRVVFNIKGNTYRLVVMVAYQRKTVYIRFVGTHAEYDRIDATEV